MLSVYVDVEIENDQHLHATYEMGLAARTCGTFDTGFRRLSEFVFSFSFLHLPS